MDAWLKPLIYGLCAMLAAPFILTQLLFAFSGWEGYASRKKKLIRLTAGMILNVIGNLAAEIAAMKLMFHIWNPRIVLGGLRKLKCSYQDIGSLALVVLAGLAAGLALGWILRRLFNRDAAETPRACRAAAVLLSVCCAALVIAGSAVSFTSVRQLYMTEICGHTKIRLMDPEEKENLGDGGWEICYVRVHNPGILKCCTEVLYLSESDENLKAIAFPDMVIPAGGTVTLAVEQVHGLDLNRKNGADVYFSDAAGGLIDQIRVPCLAKDETYVMTGRDPGSWEVRALREEKEIPFTEIPAFSVESGFYPEAFDLEITAPPGFTVRYTLDGSDPAVYGTVYEGPLPVVDRTSEENVWTAREDLSGAFVMSEPEYSVPDGPVDKCTVVRAVCVDADGRTGSVVTASYFIGYEERQGYGGIGVISLVAEPDDLFGDENGIYVLGKTYREGKVAPGTFYWYYPANYHAKGRGWEREVSLQFFDENRTLILSQQAGIRIKGGRSAGYMPKGLNLYARKEYSGSSRFEADLFGNGYRAKHLALSAAVNQIKDWLIVRMSQGLNVTMLNFRPYCLFLNGEYWGLYWLTEQYDEYYFADNYDLTEGNVVVIKAGTPKAGTEDDLKGFDEMVEQIRKSKITKAENYAAIGELLDIDAMIDYYAIELYTVNRDWELKRNQIQWRTRNQEDSSYGDTRWRPALYDLNKESILVEYSDITRTFNRMKRKDPIFKRLLKNAEFSLKFFTRLKTFSEEVFTEERFEQALAEYQAIMGEPMELEKQMLNWLEPDPEELDNIRTFISARPQYIQKLWSKYLPDTAEGKE